MGPSKGDKSLLLLEIMGYYLSFPIAIPLPRAGSHVLLTRLPLRWTNPPPFDLHVLSAPHRVRSELGSNSKKVIDRGLL